MPMFVTKLFSNTNILINVLNVSKRFLSTNNYLIKPTHYNNVSQCYLNKVRFYSTNGSVNGAITMLQMKKRPIRKKKLQDEDEKAPGSYTVIAYSSAEEYDLERVLFGLRAQDLYEPKYIENNRDALHAVAKYRVGHEPREIFFFREGSVVLWNTTELESSNVLNFLKQYEHDSYSDGIVQDEAEYMNYKHHTNG